jgi:NADPH-dependent ferric siderophore reductase
MTGNNTMDGAVPFEPAARATIDATIDHLNDNHADTVLMQASSGDPIYLWGPRRGFRVSDNAQHVLLVADETGYAAVAAVLEGLPTERRATGVLECIDVDHRPPMPDHPGLEVIWVDRGDDPPVLMTGYWRRQVA